MTTPTKHNLDCLSQKFELKYRHRSIMQKQKTLNKLIDEVLEIEANPDGYDAEYLEVKQLEAKIIAKLLLEVSS